MLETDLCILGAGDIQREFSLSESKTNYLSCIMHSYKYHNILNVFKSMC